jgi:predicted TIM-barrel fold metal-dependent hydrolase
MIVDGHLRFGEDIAVTDIDELLRQMDARDIARAILGPVGRWAAVDNHEGNIALADAARRHPDRLTGFASANPWYGQRAEQELRRALADGLIGLKLVPAQQGVPLLSPLLDGLLQVVAERALPVYVVTGVPVMSEPLQVAELARRWPTVPFVLGRSGRTDFALDLLPALTNAPNLIAETAHNGAGDIARIVEAIGADRVMFASDWPANDLGLELDRIARVPLSPSQRTAVLGRTAERLCGGAA